MTVTATRFIPPYLPKKETYKPTHPGLFVIEFGSEEDYSSCLRTERSFSKGEVICPIINTLPGIKKYSSVQVLPDPPISSSQDPAKPRHIELQSDLLYVNHSCDPNVAFEVPDEGEWKVRALKNLGVGEIMTFAYFSTEWDMDQPFECKCGASTCLGFVNGAKHIPAEVLARYQLNEHIVALKADQVAKSQAQASVKKSVVESSSLAQGIAA
ncbi:hypothetical protein MNV49_004465 [Pseudohyphozyma bogoriensis]|nr:hypothetical protein MNV49_004465 [Pseudohyphozyma bogoriensis]